MKRNFGLDIMRSAAILMVVAFHAPAETLPRGLLRDFFFTLSVDLFFAISGFLIAQMIVERFQSIPSPGALKAFLINRWMRTLPLYYLFLYVYLLLFGLHHPLMQYPAPLSGAPFLPPLAQFVFMLQSMAQDGFFDPKWHPFFPVSWSLCIEEWFYLLCPIVFLMASRFRQSAHFWFWIGMGLIVAALLGRTAVYLWDDPGGLLSQDTGYRKVTMLRPDVFVYGAAIYWATQKGWLDSRRKRGVAAAMGGITLVATALLYHQDHDSFFSKIPALSLAPLGSALCIPWMRAIRPIPILRSIVAFLSTRTYALYLAHFPVAMIWADISGGATTTVYLGSVVLSLFLANLLHLCIERPIMRRRPMTAPAAGDKLAKAPAE